MQGKINVGEYTTSTAASTSQTSNKHFLWMKTVGLFSYVRNLSQQQQNNKFSKLNAILFNLMQADCIRGRQSFERILISCQYFTKPQANSIHGLNLCTVF
jgi:hypothetical protein